MNKYIRNLCAFLFLWTAFELRSNDTFSDTADIYSVPIILEDTSFLPTNFISPYYVERDLRYLTTIANETSLSDFLSLPSIGMNLKIGKQTVGDKPWHAYYNYPRYGGGVRFVHHFNRSLGNEGDIYGFVQVPFYEIGRFRFLYHINLGLAFFSNWFDYVLNFHNVLLGSMLNVYIDLMLSSEYELNKYTDIWMALGFAHSSNGATSFPNYGLNTLSLSMGMRYYPEGRLNKDHFRRVACTEFCQYNEIYAQIALAALQSKYNSLYYGAGTLQLGFNRQFAEAFRFGFGWDLMYNSALRSYDSFKTRTQGRELDLISQAVFLSFEWQYGRLAIPIAIAFYIQRHFKFNSFFYERIGFKYYLNDNEKQYIMVSLKAHGGNADFIEWTFGSTIHRF